MPGLDTKLEPAPRADATDVGAQRQSAARYASVDVLRGLTVAAMLLVNNPGDWGHVYAPLEHAAWHGFTPTDLVFPSFLFAIGVSAWFSLRSFNHQPSRVALAKIWRRTAMLYLIGLLMWHVPAFIVSLFERRPHTFLMSSSAVSACSGYCSVSHCATA